LEIGKKKLSNGLKKLGTMYYGTKSSKKKKYTANMYSKNAVHV